MRFYTNFLSECDLAFLGFRPKSEKYAILKGFYFNNITVFSMR